MNKIPALTWLGWMAAVAVATAASVAYVHATFETKDASTSKEHHLEERLKSIDGKLDVIIEKL